MFVIQSPLADEINAAMMPSPETLPQHALRLIAIAEDALADTMILQDASPETRAAFLDGFRDEFLNRRATDRPLLARVLGIDPGPTPPPAPDAPADPAARVWWALHDEAIQPKDQLLGLEAGHEPVGPLVYAEKDSSVAIEWRTLDELAGLHALWNLAILRTRADWRNRCLGAARWHLAELQPDNATNQPWALHVFLHLAESAAAEGDAETASAARFHAETLLHSCQVQQGKPDVVSAVILLDAARTLQAETATTER